VNYCACPIFFLKKRKKERKEKKNELLLNTSNMSLVICFFKTKVDMQKSCLNHAGVVQLA
jgi:hypothetical protein